MKKGKLSPRMPWQSGVYSRRLELDIILPYEFLLLCKLLNIAPHQVVQDFMEQFSPGRHTQLRSEEKAYILSYFSAKYALPRFSEQQLKLMLAEMEVVSNFDTSAADDELLEHFELWKEKYLSHWFNKWINVRGCQI